MVEKAKGARSALRTKDFRLAPRYVLKKAAGPLAPMIGRIGQPRLLQVLPSGVQATATLFVCPHTVYDTPIFSLVK